MTIREMDSLERHSLSGIELLDGVMKRAIPDYSHIDHASLPVVKCQCHTEHYTLPCEQITVPFLNHKVIDLDLDQP